jgi:hypothetical protein
VTAPADALDAAFAVVDALDAAAIPYALGGALALGVWAIPRGTNDVDVNVFVEPAELDRLFEALRAAGAAVQTESARRAATRDGAFEAWMGPYRVDVFTPSIPYSEEARRTRRTHTIEGRTIRVLAPESLAVFKMLFFRPKDLVDVESLLAVQGASLDRAAVRRALVEAMGDDDERVRRWDAITAT